MGNLIDRDAMVAAMRKHAKGKTVLGGQTYQSLTLETALDAIAALPAVTPAPTAGGRLISAAKDALEGKVSVVYDPHPAPLTAEEIMDIITKTEVADQTASGDRRWIARMAEALAAKQYAPQPAPDAAMRLETVSENIARDMREGRFPARSEPQMVPVEPAPDPVCTDCGGTGITYQAERRCACQPAPHVNETPKSEHDAGNVLTDPAAIREAALREAINVCKVMQTKAKTNAAWLHACEIEEAIADLLTEKPHGRA